MKVKLLDLSGQYNQIKAEALREIKEVCDSQGFVLGEKVKKLEEEVAEYCGVAHAVGVASGSDAIMLALMAFGVSPGDGVITTPYTFFSTAGSISVLGAEPIFVDIDPLTYNMDPGSFERILKTRKGRSAKAVIPVHLFGQCAEMAPIKRLSRKHGIKVVEDAAQSIGAEYKGKRAGALADAGCFSFYPSKNLGCFGDGGMVTTQSKGVAERLKMLRVHGSRVRYKHEIMGVNSRLDALQAAVLRVKLKRLDGWGEKRITNARKYERLFMKYGLAGMVTLPSVAASNKSVFNQYVVRVKSRDRLRAYLTKKGIGTEIYYPLPLHLQKCFKYLGYKRGDFPVSERAARETMALPIYPELKGAELEYVVSNIARFFKKR